jgi:hypothetical protein
VARLADPQAIIDAGRGAANVFENASFRVVVKAVDARIKDDWTNSRPDDWKGREALYQKQALLQELVAELVQTIADGQIEREKQDLANG